MPATDPNADLLRRPPPAVATIMVVAAHPDDIESWCAGTLAGAIDTGATVRLLLLTSGDKGTDDPTCTAAQVAALREQEAQAAAQQLGIAEVTFLRYPDGDLEDTRPLRRAVVAWIRRWQPQVLFTHDPEHPYPPYLCHRDHRITGRVALDSAYPLARDRLTFPEQGAAGLAPHRVEEVWLFASNTPTAYVDIAAAFDRKITARLAHVSQTSDAAALRASWRQRAAAIGAPVGLALAEAFTVLQL